VAHHVLLVDLAQPNDASLPGRLVLSGFGLRTAAALTDAAGALRREPVSAALVRVGIPPEGLEAGLAGLAGVPVLALCAARDSDLAVRLLEAGADTVLTAPVSRRELAARLHALLRYRNGAPNGVGMPQFVPQRIGDLVVDPGSHTVSKNGDCVALTPTEFRLLLALAKHEGEVVSHEALLSDVWGPECSDGQEKLRLYVRYLRRKLRDEDEPRLLLNERGVGYRLVATANGRNGRNGHGHEA
jgi:DNA-binding response OmpR family regulator